ncbi:MAG: TetR/AcrR family transcriptional regulator [Terriglobales bacterium]
MAEKLHTEVRQEQIAQAALGVIATQGARKLSLAAVARKVGLVPSAIYRHFAGKEELLDVVVNHIQSRLLGNVKEVCGETEDPAQRLYRLLCRHVELIRSNRAGILRVVFSGEISSGRPERKKRIYRMVRAYLVSVAQIFEEGQRNGHFRSDLDPQTASVMFLALVQPGAVLWHMSSGEFDAAQHAEKAWKYYREVITAKE